MESTSSLPKTKNPWLQEGPNNNIYEPPRASLEWLQKLSSLEKIDNDVYRAHHLVPGFSTTKNVYGGLTFAQAILAAEQTVDSKFLPHSVQSFFILNATIEKPIDYRVSRIRDGRSFCTRLVQAEQTGQIVFTAQISLHVKEPSAIEHQQEMPDVPGPDNLRPYFDLVREAIADHDNGRRPLFDNNLKRLNIHLLEEQSAFFEFRPVTPGRFLAVEPHFPDKPEYFWMRCIVPIPSIEANDSNSPSRSLHRFMLAFVTDTTLASIANRPHFSHGHRSSMILSLDHSVHFHDEFLDSDQQEPFRVDDWLLYENYSPFAANGRAFSEGRVWAVSKSGDKSRRNGRLICTVSQESLSRSLPNEKSSL